MDDAKRSCRKIGCASDNAAAVGRMEARFRFCGHREGIDALRERRWSNLLKPQRQVRRPNPEREWAQQALMQTRQSIQGGQRPTWLQSHDETMRQQYRELGRKLMGLALQFVAADEGDASGILDEAREIGRLYAANAHQMRMPLAEALRTFLFFRDTLIETAVQMPDSGRARPDTNRRLMRRINTLLNTVHLTIVEAYENNGIR